MFHKSGEVICDQFEPLNIVSFWVNSENGCRGEKYYFEPYQPYYFEPYQPYEPPPAHTWKK